MSGHIHSEVRRLQYLDALGVESYIPVRILPGAFPSILCDWPQGVPVFVGSVLTENATASQQAGETVVDKGSLSRLQRDLESPPRQLASYKASTAVNPMLIAPDHRSAAVLQCQLAIFQPTKKLLLLVPAQHTDKIHLQLLRNILLAVGIKPDVLAPRDNFVWPPRIQAAVKMDISLNAARETLHSLLEGYLVQDNTHSLLVFAGTLAEKLFPEQLCPQQQLAGMPLYLLPDLQQMLEDSQYKKVTWQKIRDLNL